MLKFMFEYLTNSFSLLENPVDNYIIMAVVLGIAYLIAYNIVGWLYHVDVIEGRSAGRVLHWVIRFIVFLILYYLFATIIRIYKWIISVPKTIWLIVMIFMFGIAGVAGIIKFIFNRKGKGEKV